MAITIQETFQVEAAIARVWEYLTDPQQVVTCLPGAELMSIESPTKFRGRVTVKVGPIVAAYEGTVTLLERDDTAHVVRIAAEGRESAGAGGGGSAKMTMTSTLIEPVDGTTEVRVMAEVDVVGRIAQFGRGMIESVNRQMFKQFTTCMRETLLLPITTSAPILVVPSPEAAAAAAPNIAAVSTPAATYAPPATAVRTARARPVRVLPLLLRALRERVRLLFRPHA